MLAACAVVRSLAWARASQIENPTPLGGQGLRLQPLTQVALGASALDPLFMRVVDAVLDADHTVLEALASINIAAAGAVDPEFLYIEMESVF